MHCVIRAFALEGCGVWHAASVSLSQQVFGPVRARWELYSLLVMKLVYILHLALPKHVNLSEYQPVP